MIFEYVNEVFECYPECIVHPVSCTGVSHDALSKKIKKSYPDYFREYTRLCIRKKLLVGHAFFYIQEVLFGTKFLVTFTVKDNWQEKIQPQIFKHALEEFIQKAIELKLTTVALPKLEEVPQNWLEEQFKKAAKNETNTIQKVLFF